MYYDGNLFAELILLAYATGGVVKCLWQFLLIHLFI